MNRSVIKMQQYEKQWKSGFKLIISGAFMAVIGFIPQNNVSAAVGAILGGIMAIAGHVKMNWVGLTQLGTAGYHLNHYNERMRQSGMP